MERRQFSKYEQETIKTIVMSAGDRVDYLLVNVYNDIFYYTNVEYIDEKLHFYYKDTGEWNNSRGNQTLFVQKDIIVKTLLLIYLEENRLIYLVADSNVQNFSPNIQTANKKDTLYELELDLPKDIAKFLSNTKRRVIVSEELKVLVENDFKTYEDLQLESAEKQLRSSNANFASSLQNIEIARDLVNTTQEQLKEIKEQTKTLQSQLKEVQKQSKEARKQTKSSQEQIDLAQQQLNEAHQQTENAQEQTNEAKGQRKAAWWAVGMSGIAIVVAIIMPHIVTRCNKDKEKNEAVENTMVSIDKLLVPSSQHISNQIDSIKANTDILQQQNDSLIKLSKAKALNTKSKSTNKINKK